MTPGASRLSALAALAIAGLPAMHPLGATEKHWIAHEADVIVVGTLRPWPVFPWLTGWQLYGTIRVDEVLYGKRVPREVRVRFPCPWAANCQLWPAPVFPEMYLESGLWFLRRGNRYTWLPSDGLGFQELSSRSYWENYIRFHKVPVR